MAWIENLKLKVDRFHLDIPRWDFPDEGITCIWGASGSGKSSLLQVIAGLTENGSLKLSVGGQLLSELPPRQRNLGFVFQDFGLFPHMTTFENIAFAAEAKKLPEDLWRDHADSLIQKLKLTSVRNQRASTLSGGEQQRVALARALVTKPRMVLLDEPLSALDENVKDSARKLIKDLSVEYKVPFLMVSHDLRDVRLLSHSCLVLSDGKMVGSGGTSELLSRPQPALMKLIPENQILSVQKERERFLLSGVEVKGKILPSEDSHSYLVSKTWSFEVVRATGQRRFDFQILNRVDEGPHWNLVLRLGDGQEIKALSTLDEDLFRGPLDLKIDEKSFILLEGKK